MTPDLQMLLFQEMVGSAAMTALHQKSLAQFLLDQFEIGLYITFAS